jgi:hypothetical protein
MTSACVSNTSSLDHRSGDASDRDPASAGAVTPAVDAMDPKFESFWKGDANKEKEAVESVGRVIGQYVQKQAGLNREWEAEFGALQAKKAHGALSASEQKRSDALSVIIRDLPQTPGMATRDVHRKPHGCFAAQVKMNANIPADLQKGFFKPSQTYDAIVRFSNGNPKNQPENAVAKSSDRSVRLHADTQNRSGSNQPADETRSPGD